MAQVGKSNKRHLDLYALADLIRNPIYGLPDQVAIEHVHAMPKQGVTSMFRFGHAFGAVLGVVAALGLPVAEIRPQVWRRAAGLRTGPDAGRLLAPTIFPTQAHLFARQKDQGRADAALIALAQIKIARR